MDQPLSRRNLLLSGGAALVMVACSDKGSAGGTSIGSSAPAATGPTPTPVPTTTSAAPTTTAVPQEFDLKGLSPYFTPNKRFFQIDIGKGVPEIDPATWTLSIGGMVDSPISFTYDELRARPQVERTILLACVSNSVGGTLTGNAVWKGVFLADLLREAGVRDGATQVFCTSTDGFTCGFPVDVALDGRDAMLAFEMNGEPISPIHGYPARLIVPGLYGYVSASKWLTDIKLTTWEADQGFWIPLGWSIEAPVKTQCRIDVPRSGASLEPGPTYIAGVAWAPHTGVSKVEVQIDQGEWQVAEFAAADVDDSWRQWRLAWTAVPGSHVIRARTTAKDGITQTEETSYPAPNGATGYPTRGFRVDL